MNGNEQEVTTVSNQVHSASRMKVKKIAFIALMGAVSAVLMLMRFPIPFMPPFLSFDLSGVMEIMGGLMFGPVEALCIIVVKILLQLVMQGTMSLGTGELQNFLLSSAYVLPAVFIYHRKKTRKSAALGMAVSCCVVAVVAVLTNLYLIIPFYAVSYTHLINLVSREILTGLSVIRAFGREKKEEERFDDANRSLTKTTLFTNRIMTFMMPGMMLIMNVLTISIVWVGAHRIDSGDMQVGAMTAFITYAMMIVMSFLMLTMLSIMLPRAAVAAERIDEVIVTESSIHDADQTEAVTERNGVIRFDHVNFRYPGAEEDVLHDIDFIAEPGKTTAIIGSTGCGKSTLVNLIPRLYDVTGGKMCIRDRHFTVQRKEMSSIAWFGWRILQN